MQYLERRAFRKKLGDFANAVARSHCPGQFGEITLPEAVEKGLAVEKTAMAENSGATGGYLVPYELNLGIDSKLEEISLFHRYAYCQPMKTRTCDFPSFDLTANQVSGISPILGGMKVSWGTTEGASLTESEPTFGNGQLVAKDLEGYVVVSNQLVNDGGESLGSYLEAQFAKAIRFFVERACFQGLGTTQPLGIVNAPGTVQLTRASGGTIGLADIQGMVQSILPASFVNAIWAVSPTGFNKIVALAQSYFINTGVIDSETLPGFVGTLLTRPLFVTENLPAVGTLGDLVLFDPTMYALGTRGIEIAASPHPKFLTNQTVYRIWWRGDGQPQVKNTFKLADNSTTSGCYVALK